MVRVPVPSGPLTGTPRRLFVELPAMVRFVPPARLTPPVKVLAPLTCRLPPPLTVIAPFAFWSTEAMARVAWSGATFWLLKLIGLTVMVEATLFKSTMPPVMVEVEPTLFDEAVMVPLLIFRRPATVRVGFVMPPSLLKVRVVRALLRLRNVSATVPARTPEPEVMVTVLFAGLTAVTNSLPGMPVPLTRSPTWMPLTPRVPLGTVIVLLPSAVTEVAAVRRSEAIVMALLPVRVAACAGMMEPAVWIRVPPFRKMPPVPSVVWPRVTLPELARVTVPWFTKVPAP